MTDRFTRDDLMEQLVRRSPYGRELLPYLDEIIAIADLNIAARDAVHRIMENSDFSNRGAVRPMSSIRDVRLLNRFFEYLYFSSPAFNEKAANERHPRM